MTGQNKYGKIIHLLDEGERGKCIYIEIAYQKGELYENDTREYNRYNKFDKKK